jgi:glycerol-3-phosphate acyltransferase PlsY
MTQETWRFIVCGILSYLLGSVPFGLLITRFAGYGDIRQIGSGNIGATNVLRTGNKKLAGLTLLLDAGKGIVAVLVAARWGADMTAVAALMVIIGHLFPVWLRFKGGKGVATAGGVLIAYVWPAALCAVATWLAIAVVTRYSSLAALTAAILTPVYTWFLTGGDGERTIVTIVVALLVIWRHAANIGRLLHGEEGKISLRKKSA